MSGVLERTLGILETLAVHPEGLALGTIAEKLNMPASATHRLLTELGARGYVKQIKDQGDYVLTTKLVSMVLDYMGAAGIVDFAQPVLDRLAFESGEFVRLAVVDGERLTWVARAQGARRGLRYDPDVDVIARLSCTASGQAWLMTMSDEDALTLVARQGFGRPADLGPNAPTTATALMKILADTRVRGYASTHDSFAPGLSSMAMPIRRAGQGPVGVISIAGPSVRLDDARMLELAPLLKSAAHEISVASVTSPLFASHRVAHEVETGAARGRKSTQTPKAMLAKTGT
ncbi:MAG: IclR family transcriptional regulator [Beijerinckiaceae bacterium]